MRLRGLLIALLFAAQWLQGDDQQQIEKVLNDEYGGKVVTIRGFYKQSKLDYDSSGEPKVKGESGPWTLYGKLQLTRLKVKKGRLEVEGNRLWVAWVPDPKGNREMRLMQTTDGVLLRADLSQSEPDQSEIRKILARIFLNPGDQMSDQVPEHWRRFFGGATNGARGLSGSKPPSGKSPPVEGKAPAKNEGGNLVKRVDPGYPEPAKRARLEGVVVLDVVIDKQGRIKSLSVSQPLGLGTEESAVEAVSQWVYKPYLGNGEPVEVDTKITVNYQLIVR